MAWRRHAKPLVVFSALAGGTAVAFAMAGEPLPVVAGMVAFALGASCALGLVAARARWGQLLAGDLGDALGLLLLALLCALPAVALLLLSALLLDSG
jgi:hypothetical protein